jgi:chromosomal replication initiator protein
MNKEELWQSVLSRIQLNISSANFSTWFKNTSIISKEEGGIVIGVPNNFSKEWLEKKYNKLILNILQDLNERIRQIEYRVINVPPPINKAPQKQTSFVNQLEIEELSLDKNTNLNPKYTFNNFVVGPFNEFAHAAAYAITKNPGIVYNPFFVYGGVGLGKTHLLQAVGNIINETFKKKRVRYIASERFVSGIVSAIRNQTIEQFKNTYRDFDVLIIDDIQFLAGKEKSQEEFFHLFNILYESNKQIIISSDRPPKSISSIEERLRSRFEGGMITDIAPPDIESRLAILKQKIQEKKSILDELVLEYLASSIQRNVRELEGALNHLIAWQELNSQKVNLTIAKHVLKKTINPSSKRLNFQNIVKSVAQFYNLEEKELFQSSRKKEFVRPRQVAMYILRSEMKASYPFIGKKFGGRDHTTAIYACEKIAQEIEKNEQFSEELELIKEKIYNY